MNCIIKCLINSLVTARNEYLTMVQNNFSDFGKRIELNY